jgi:Ca2+-binding EF-hand superfamily protein
LFDTSLARKIQFIYFKYFSRAIQSRLKKNKLQVTAVQFFAFMFNTISINVFHLEELKQAFDYFDTEHKLELGLKELKVIAKHLDRNLSDDELMAVVQAVDKSNSEAIKYEGMC